MKARTRTLFAAALVAILTLWASASPAADPADFPALEWMEGEGAHERVVALDGVVLVDLYADY